MLLANQVQLLTLPNHLTFVLSREMRDILVRYVLDVSIVTFNGCLGCYSRRGYHIESEAGCAGMETFCGWRMKIM